jgi:hypothetical protein
VVLSVCLTISRAGGKRPLIGTPPSVRPGFFGTTGRKVRLGVLTCWTPTTVERFHPELLEAEKQAAIYGLDKIIEPALGLDFTDLEAIWRDCAVDPFLKRVKPRYPGTVTRKQGFRAIGTSMRSSMDERTTSRCMR